MKKHSFKYIVAYILMSNFFIVNVIAQNTNTPYKLPRPVISESNQLHKKSIDVLGSKMSYLETGKGEPVIFIHGNPSSSYLWRNIMPYVVPQGRAIAVDLIGMGESDKPDIDYTFEEQYKYFSFFVDALNVKHVTLVGHDWGATLAWEYARRNSEKVRKLAFLEGVLPPAFPVASFELMGEEMGNMFRAFKDPVKGEKLIIQDNMFIEKILPRFVNRTLGKEAMETYRAPFIKPEYRKPVLAWPRQVPIAGEPEFTVKVLNSINQFMGETNMPVLLIYADPGVVIPPLAVDWYVTKILNLETAFVGQGLHFIQEDQPDSIGRAIADWMRRNKG